MQEYQHFHRPIADKRRENSLSRDLRTIIDRHLPRVQNPLAVFMRLITVLIIASILVPTLSCRADSPPATQPAQTGDLVLTFTERAPQSTPKEIARRLSLKDADIAPDYDLSQQPFHAYVPSNYDPATPVGIFVYLGYKDTVETPHPWLPILEKSHLIFISAAAHHGEHYSPSVPLAEVVGLAMDAVFNLKHQYKIDEKRIYLMTFTDGGPRAAFGTSDIFTGFICAFDTSYYGRLNLPNNQFYPPTMPPPPAELLTRAKSHPFFFIDSENWQPATLRLNAMKGTGFAHVTLEKLSLETDVHYPNMKADWFENNAIPFLDSATSNIKPPRPATAQPVAPSAAATKPAPDQSEAQHLLSLAKLEISNNLPDLARPKLQEILAKYPNDPAAAQAKDLLDKIGN
jgi:hypothetical protein